MSSKTNDQNPSRKWRVSERFGRFSKKTRRLLHRRLSEPEEVHKTPNPAEWVYTRAHADRDVRLYERGVFWPFSPGKGHEQAFWPKSRPTRPPASNPRRSLSEIPYGLDLACPFLSVLPFELRQLIFTFAIGLNTLQVCYNRVVVNGEYERGGPDIALLLTCRQIYVEAIDIMYTANTFVFDSLSRCDRLRGFLPQHVCRIRNMQIEATSHYSGAFREWDRYKNWNYYHDWYLPWEWMTNQLTGLRNLTVHLTMRRGPQMPRLSVEAEWVKPLLKFRSSTNFTLIICILTERGYEVLVDDEYEEKEQIGRFRHEAKCLMSTRWSLEESLIEKEQKQSSSMAS
ncbi:hypothetical protein MMC20_006379 [Loxospora ochrophaea]|nr:hypothetical protein [Loxospora ochrophaea]